MLRVNIESLTILSTLYVRDYADVEGTQLINVSSALGYVIAVGSVAYSASKYYVSAFTEGLAKELELKGAKTKGKGFSTSNDGNGICEKFDGHGRI